MAQTISVPAYHILLALAHGERHGYGIIKEVEDSTSGNIRLLAGTLYRLLKEMVADGWIVEIDGDEDEERRRYYRLTPRGRRIAIAESERLESLVRTARARKLLPAGRLV
ncbi:MAG TPA: PadR family transcriptional regulator [Candidatus Baltobacteraceae bacterium]|nr:PadR family transcriptional regulator [Candidatus Baltobacteraceae bacterium]